MQDVLANWSPDFVVSVLRDYVLPVIVGGVAIGAMFWLVGHVVDNAFRWLR